jgi:hypothetical protein
MSSFTPDITNKKFELALQLVNQSNRSIFLTGKAGTGKTTFLKYIRENCSKQMVVLAPTGVAAINAGGVTIHSFFQLPLSPFIPSNVPGQVNGHQNNSHTLLKSLRYNQEKRKQIQQLELLVIDEISMVRADILDEIDLVLRHFRHRLQERFGGVQVLFIGDMMQLPPVIRDEEWQLLSPYYNGPFFFNSHALKEHPPVYIEFDKIYRQNEEIFLNLLNQIRDNALDEEGVKLLESRYDPGFQPDQAEGYIILTTHNNKANEINYKSLENIQGEARQYNAGIKNEFPDRAYPAEAVMNLKVGAQVMFIRNDNAENGKRFFNGKIGTVTRLEPNKIFVECHYPGEDSKEIEVQQETWENIRYKINKSTGNLDAEVLGSFTQFPLRLAWAITIHKSQGLTFEKAIIDAGEAFAPGQVYVALSRCTTLSGLVLKSRIRKNAILSDPAIVEFSKQEHTREALQQELEISKKQYLLSILLSTFDFSFPEKTASDLFKYLDENQSSFIVTDNGWKTSILAELKKLQQTAGRFQQELRLLFLETNQPDQSLLQNRVSAGAGFFMNEINRVNSLLKKPPLTTDSWTHAKEINEMLSYLFEILSRKQDIMEGMAVSIDPDIYHKRRQHFRIPSFRVNVHSVSQQLAEPSEHPLLYKKLKALRDRICLSKNLPVYLVASSKTLEEMVQYLPQDKSELKKIRGFGDAKIEQYGAEFLDIITDYSIENGLSSQIAGKDPKRERKIQTLNGKLKSDTREASFRLYKEGASISEIAKQRNLKVETIEGHLRTYIENGEININEILPGEKISAITNALKDWDRVSITPVKQKLGDDYGYGEIRMVISHLHSSH